MVVSNSLVKKALKTENNNKISEKK